MRLRQRESRPRKRFVSARKKYLRTLCETIAVWLRSDKELRFLKDVERFSF